jgi:RNA polymerase sigma factor (sigma-70 family)
MEKSADSEPDRDTAPGMPAGGAAPSAGEGTAERLFLEHGPRMRRVAIRRFNVPCSVADELLQDVFVNYLLSQSKVHTNVQGYLIGAISNACRNYWRAQRSEGRVFEEGDLDGAVSPDRDIFGGLATNLAVASTLARLPSRCREALRRYYLRDEDTATIARAMDTTSGNVNYLMHKCRKRAREIYETMTRMR